jgi:hypothetical protein
MEESDKDDTKNGEEKNEDNSAYARRKHLYIPKYLKHYFEW